MEHEPLKRYWTRWPGIIGLFLIGLLGCALLYMLYSLDKTHFEDLSAMLWFCGSIFILFGFVGSALHYFDGATSYLESKVFLKDLDDFKKFDNGIMVSLNGVGKLYAYPYHYKKIEERGYIKILTQFNRKGERKSWHFMVV